MGFRGNKFCDSSFCDGTFRDKYMFYQLNSFVASVFVARDLVTIVFVAIAPMTLFFVTMALATNKSTTTIQNSTDFQHRNEDRTQSIPKHFRHENMKNTRSKSTMIPSLWVSLSLCSNSYPAPTEMPRHQGAMSSHLINVCVYVCFRVYMYTCLNVYVCIYIYMCGCVCIYQC